MAIYDEYVGLCRTYAGKYGPDTAVLMQIGDFFELQAGSVAAAPKPPRDGKERKKKGAGSDQSQSEAEAEQAVVMEGADIHRVAELCNLVVTRKNKALPEAGRTNPLMAGFPLHVVYKHAATLVGAGWTVVLVRQVAPPPAVKRAVTEVLSPATMLAVQEAGGGGATGGGAAEGSYLVALHWQRCARTRLASVGVAGVDVGTGRSFAAEAASTASDPSRAYDEAYRLLHAYAPKELVLIGEEDAQATDALAHAQAAPPQCVHARWGQQKEYERLAYQEEVLGRAFAGRGCMLSMVQVAGLERLDLARTAFAYVLQFAHEHNEAIVQRVQLPEVLAPDRRLTLEYNSALQLNLTGAGGPGERPLLGILNRCATALGGRLFRERLLSPSSDPAVIAARLDEVERLVRHAATRAEVHAQLRGVLDLERMLRRMVVGAFHPLDWCGLHAAMERAAAVHAALAAEQHPGGGGGEHEAAVADALQACCASYADVLDLDECAKYVVGDIRGNVFRRGVHADLDADADALEAQLALVRAHADALSASEACRKGAAATATAGCKVECSDRDGHHLVMTKRRWDLARKEAALAGGVCGTPWADFRTAPVSASSAALRITCPAIERASAQVLRLQARMGAEVAARYREFVRGWLDRHEADMQRCAAWLARVDVACTCARNAVEYGYVRPELATDETTERGGEGEEAAGAGASFVECRGMRHPIIERLRTQVDYVANDVALHASAGGILLYGINASGKSSAMKAVGLNVLMAQAGMFVACAGMRLRPYARLFTRISGADNIYRGMSSFTVEMSELRNILQRADRRSLVLGDELCCGTEAVSALAIVTAGVHHLSRAGASFIFATHLHDLTAMPAIRQLGAAVRVLHMHIELDEATGAIVYHRKLREGQGSGLYGLEVCRALDMPDGFLRLADATRRHVQGVPADLVAGGGKRRSRYNADVYLDACGVCGAERAGETHHIRYQRDADPDTGLVRDDGGVRHVHRASNLVPLCEACHAKEHAGRLRIVGYADTSRGRKLQVHHHLAAATDVDAGRRSEAAAEAARP